MKNSEIAATIAELMAAYDESKARWFAKYDSTANFDAWFTAQVNGRCITPCEAWTA